MGDKLTFRLIGGPHDGQEVFIRENTWRAELNYIDPYARYATAKAVYVRRSYVAFDLYYQSSLPCDGHRSAPIFADEMKRLIAEAA